MVTAATVKGLAERLAKAEQLVASGAVYPVAGLDGYAVVKNGDGSQMYLVRTDAEHEHCTCPDFTARQEAQGLPCKHLMAAQLAAVPSDKERGRKALAVLNGDPDDYVFTRTA